MLSFKANIKICVVLLCSFLSYSCSNEESSDFKDWTGNELEFKENFKYSSSLDSTEILIEKKSKRPISGKFRIEETDFISEQSFVSGKLHGTSMKSREDGSRVEARFEEGLLDGEMKFFDSSGTLRSVIVYSKGKLAPGINNQTQGSDKK